MRPDREVQDPGRGFLTRRMAVVNAIIVLVVAIGLIAWLIMIPPWD